METSDRPSDALRDDIANAHSHDSLPLPLSVSAEAAALYGHLTGRTLGYPTHAHTVEDLAHYRLAALAGAVVVELLDRWAASGDDSYLEAAAEEFMNHSRISEEAGPIIASIASVVGPAVHAALPYLLRPEGGTDAPA